MNLERKNRPASGHYLTDEEREEIALLFDIGLTQIEIARVMGRGEDAVRRALQIAGRRSSGLPRGDSSFDGAARRVILRMAGDGEQPLAIARATAFPVATVERVLLAGEPRHAAGVRRRQLDPTCFRARTNEVAYWAGFLYADGCVEDSGRVTLKLKSGDRDHVLAFRRFLGSDAKITEYETTCSVTVRSSVLAGDLGRLGIIPRKTWAGEGVVPWLAKSPRSGPA